MAADTLGWLWGARIQRVDLPEPALLCVTLYSEGTRHHLLARLDGSALPALCPERPRGDSAGGLAQKLRKRLVGVRLRQARWLGEKPGRPFALTLEVQGAEPGSLHVVLDPRHANLVCCDGGGRAIIVADTARFRALGGRLGQPWSGPAPAAAAPFPDTPDAWMERAAGLLRGAQSDQTTRKRQELERGLRRKLRSVEKRVAAIQGDLARADRAAQLREDAEWLLCHLQLAQPGTRQLQLPARPGESEPCVLQLDPAFSALANAQRWFKQARRHARGRPIAARRLAEAEAEREGLRTWLTEVADAAEQGTAALAAVGDRLAAALPGGMPGHTARPSDTARARGNAQRLPFRRFLSEADQAILVGRSAADNDELTLRYAKPQDLWLHVRDAPGSHVVVPLARHVECPDRVRLDAALLAAHFSPQRNEDALDVVVVERRHVRKRRGSPAGSVELGRERVLRLRSDEARLRWLLARERRPD